MVPPPSIPPCPGNLLTTSLGWFSSTSCPTSRMWPALHRCQKKGKIGPENHKKISAPPPPLKIFRLVLLNDSYSHHFLPWIGGCGPPCPGVPSHIHVCNASNLAKILCCWCCCRSAQVMNSGSWSIGWTVRHQSRTTSSNWQLRTGSAGRNSSSPINCSYR